MIITAVTILKLRYDMPPPMADAIHYMPARPLLLVQVHTDERIVDTPFWVEVDKQFAKLMDLPVGEPKRRAVASIPPGRIEQPDDVAAMALFLASSDADYITQQCFNVDGGNWPS